MIMTKNNTETKIVPSTNLAELKKDAYRLLDEEIKFIGKDRILHPIWTGRYVTFNGVEDAPMRPLDIVGNPSDLQMATNIVREEIRKYNSPVEVFQCINPSWRFTILHKDKKWLSIDDMTEVLRYAWDSYEYLADVGFLSKGELLEMLKTCNPELLMPYSIEQEEYQALPEEVTVYRGVSRLNKRIVKTFSWTLTPTVVTFPGDRLGSCNGKAYRAKIKKCDIFARLTWQGEVIVNPDKLYDIEKFCTTSLDTSELPEYAQPKTINICEWAHMCYNKKRAPRPEQTC